MGQTKPADTYRGMVSNAQGFEDAWKAFETMCPAVFKHPDEDPMIEEKVRIQIKSIYIMAYAAGGALLATNPYNFTLDLRDSSERLDKWREDFVKRFPLEGVDQTTSGVQ